MLLLSNILIKTQPWGMGSGGGKPDKCIHFWVKNSLHAGDSAGQRFPYPKLSATPPAKPSSLAGLDSSKSKDENRRVLSSGLASKTPKTAEIFSTFPHAAVTPEVTPASQTPRHHEGRVLQHLERTSTPGEPVPPRSCCRLPNPGVSSIPPAQKPYLHMAVRSGI